MKISMNMLDNLILNNSIISLRTDDEDRVIREITKKKTNDRKTFFWTAYLGLHEVPFHMKIETFTISKFQRSKCIKDSILPDQVLDIIEADSRTKIHPNLENLGQSRVYFLLDFFHHTAVDPTLARGLKDIARAASIADSSIVVTSVDYHRHSITDVGHVVELENPTNEEIAELLKTVDKQIVQFNEAEDSKKNQIDPKYDLDAVIQSLKGLSEVKIVEFMQISMTELNLISPEKIYELRKISEQL